MADANYIARRVAAARAHATGRDANHARIIAMRNGEYEKVAPGLFNDSEFGQPLVSNLIDTTARDIAEVMAPLPSFQCQSASLSNDADQKRQDIRSAIANWYVQRSRLQDQMYEGADRYGSFGFMAYTLCVDEEGPVLRIGKSASAYYAKDHLGRVREYMEVYSVRARTLLAEYDSEETGLFNRLREKLGGQYDTAWMEKWVDVCRWYDKDQEALVLLDPELILTSVKNPLGKCMVRVVERPDITGSGPRGQFDDVLWVQIARALVQMYTMNAIERSVNAPVVLPKDVQELELGPFAAIQTDNPGGVGTVPLQISPGLFPQAQSLQMEQMVGSRYPEGRSGSLDASIITGQGVEALMGTFNTQVATFQRLNASALEDILEMAFELDEKVWGDMSKTVRLKDNGAPRKLTYSPAKDINGDYTIDVSYGAIAGLDPNRGLVFLLQGLAGGLISKSTARKYLPVDISPMAEEREIQKEQLEESVAAAMAQLPLAIPQMAMSGMDPREMVTQIVQISDLIQKGKSPTEAIQKVFAPKQQAQPAAPEPAAPSPGGAMPQASTPGSDMLMMLAGLNPSGSANLQAGVSRMQPI